MPDAIPTAQEVEHMPTIVVRAASTPLGLYSGACQCGWIASGIGSRQRAHRDARTHVDTVTGVQ